MAEKKDKATLDIYINTKGVDATFRELSLHARHLRNEMAGLPPKSEEFRRVAQKLRDVNGRLDAITASAKKTGFSFMSMKDMLFAGGWIGVGMSLFNGLKEKVVEAWNANLKLSDSMADIRKTTGMTTPEVSKLITELNKIDTRTSSEDLQKIAISAGQLGIAKGDVLAFTSSVDKLNVALGDEFGDAETITKEIGGLRNIFSDVKSDKIDEDILKIGNALNELGASGAATGDVVADFAGRIGGVGIPLGLTSGQVLGLSATLQELNVNTERGGTAVVSILQKMSTNVADFASVAGLPIEEFAYMVNTDLFGAFNKVIEGANKSGGSATALAGIMKRLNIDGAGASEVFAKLGSNTDLLAKRVDLATDSLQNTNSVMNEFNTKNTTAAANMEKLSKWFANLFVNPTLTAGMDKFTKFLADMVTVPRVLEPLVDVFRSIMVPIKGAIAGFMNLWGAILPFNDSISTATFVFKLLATAIQTAFMPLRVLYTTVQLVYDSFGALINEAKRLMNFFGSEFEINPKMTFKTVEENYEKNKKEFTSAYKQIWEDEGADSADPMQDLKTMSSMGGGIKREQVDFTSKKPTDSKQQAAMEEAIKFKEQQDAADKANEEKARKQQEHNDKEIEKIREQSEKVKAEAATLATELSAMNAMAEIEGDIEKENKAQEETVERFEAAEKLRELFRTEEEQEIEAARNKYLELKNLADIHHLDTAGLVELREAQIAEIKAKYAEKALEKEKKDGEKSKKEQQKIWAAKMEAAAGFGDLMGSINELIGKKGKEMNDFQKSLALAQIAIDTAGSVSSVIRGAAAAAAETGPLGPFMLAGYIASGLAAVFAGIAQAKQVLATAPEPKEEPKKEKVSRGTAFKEFWTGGYTGIGIGQADSRGHKVAGVVHDGEYVVNKSLMANPYIADTVAIIDSLRLRGFADGGYTTAPPQPTPMFEPPTSTIDPALIQVLSEISQTLRNPQPSKAYLVYDEFQEETQKIDTIKTEANT